ncbi:MAG: class I SAM-dependent methyltransferase, partial [Acidobacteriota bacterium]
MKPIRFLREFVRAPSQTGALLPSNRRLSDVITEKANLRSASVVVEMGPGNGVCTEVILEKIPRNAHFLALEINASFVAATRRRCPKAVVHHDDASRTRHHLEELGVRYCDAVVSGLPWASLSGARQDDLLGTILDVLRPGGRFVTFAYLQGLLLPPAQRFRSTLQKRF